MKSLIKFFILIFIIFLMVFGIFVLLDKQKNISYSPQQINFENMYLKPDFSLLKLDSPDGCENSIYYGEGFVQNCVGTIFSQQDQNNNEIGENIFVNIPGSNLGFNYQLTEYHDDGAGLLGVDQNGLVQTDYSYSGADILSYKETVNGEEFYTSFDSSSGNFDFVDSDGKMVSIARDNLARVTHAIEDNTNFEDTYLSGNPDAGRTQCVYYRDQLEEDASCGYPEEIFGVLGDSVDGLPILVSNDYVTSAEVSTNVEQLTINGLEGFKVLQKRNDYGRVKEEDWYFNDVMEFTISYYYLPSKADRLAYVNKHYYDSSIGVDENYLVIGGVSDPIFVPIDDAQSYNVGTFQKNVQGNLLWEFDNGEECDDGNTVDGDGCSSNGKINLICEETDESLALFRQSRKISEVELANPDKIKALIDGAKSAASKSVYSPTLQCPPQGELYSGMSCSENKDESFVTGNYLENSESGSNVYSSQIYYKLNGKTIVDALKYANSVIDNDMNYTFCPVEYPEKKVAIGINSVVNGTITFDYRISCTNVMETKTTGKETQLESYFNGIKSCVSSGGLV
jgi:cysteine-rich repeat protein